VEKLTLFIVVNMRGTINCPYRIRKALASLKVERKFNASLAENKPEVVGMLKSAKDYVAWCEIDSSTLALILEKRGMASKRKRLTREILEKNGFNDFSELAEKVVSGNLKVSSIKFMKPFFRLKPPEGGFPKPLRRQYTNKGFLGYNPELKEFIGRML
jgi:large subunit ribosomal protein L30